MLLNWFTEKPLQSAGDLPKHLVHLQLTENDQVMIFLVLNLLYEVMCQGLEIQGEISLWS